VLSSLSVSRYSTISGLCQVRYRTHLVVMLRILELETLNLSHLAQLYGYISRIVSNITVVYSRTRYLTCAQSSLLITTKLPDQIVTIHNVYYNT
jgi:hypothetical protein